MKRATPTIPPHIAILAAIRSLRHEVRKQNSILKHCLLRAPGRPRHLRVTQAAKLLKEGKPWAEIRKVCLPPRAAYDSKEEYRTADERLRKAAEKRLERDGTKLTQYVPSSGRPGSSIYLDHEAAELKRPAGDASAQAQLRTGSQPNKPETAKAVDLRPGSSSKKAG